MATAPLSRHGSLGPMPITAVEPWEPRLQPHAAVKPQKPRPMAVRRCRAVRASAMAVRRCRAVQASRTAALAPCAHSHALPGVEPRAMPPSPTGRRRAFVRLALSRHVALDPQAKAVSGRPTASGRPVEWMGLRRARAEHPLSRARPCRPRSVRRRPPTAGQRPCSASRHVRLDPQGRPPSAGVELAACPIRRRGEGRPCPTRN
jgi:hypothetical protein